VYGISSFGLARGTGLTVQEAQTYIDKYFKKYSGVKAYLDKTVEETREKGYITTLFNRRRYLPDIRSRRWALRNFAERAAMNAPIQGTAADIIKDGHGGLGAGDRCLWNCVQRCYYKFTDELVFEVHTEDVGATVELVRKKWRELSPSDVPLVVEVKIGPNWAGCSGGTSEVSWM